MALAQGAAATRSPAESNTGLPGESNTGLPGESNTGLPGATFGCPGVPASGAAACTIAINLNVPPNPNPQATLASLHGLTPQQIQQAYQLPSGNAGTTVAIVDAYDDPSAEADLAVYRAAFGLPACTSVSPAADPCFRKVNESGQSGSPPATNLGWAAEIALDLDMVSAACPHCRILLVEAGSASIDDLGRAVDQAVSLGAHVVSNSYYAVEWAGESSEDAHYRHAGVAITVASGDRGYQSYPAASADVTAVGGTSLSASGSTWNESSWEYTGHGCSAFVAKPAWQTATPCSHGRDGVDVAAVADPQTGVATYCSICTVGGLPGGWYVAGGTSVGAPLIAGAYALSGRYDTAAFSYAHAADFRAVGATNGHYDAVTGLGSPLGVAGL